MLGGVRRPPRGVFRFAVEPPPFRGSRDGHTKSSGQLDLDWVAALVTAECTSSGARSARERLSV